jgi:hypothetical protein
MTGHGSCRTAFIWVCVEFLFTSAEGSRDVVRLPLPSET